MAKSKKKQSVPRAPVGGRGKKTAGKAVDLPFYILSDMVLFPRMTVPLELDSGSKDFVDHIMAGKGLFVLITRDQTDPDQIYNIGTAAVVRRRGTGADGTMRLQLRTLGRMRIVNLLPPDPFPVAHFEPLAEQSLPTGKKAQGQFQALRGAFSEFLTLSPHLSNELAQEVHKGITAGELADLAATLIDISVSAKQEILECLAAGSRLQKVLPPLLEKLEILQLAHSIQEQVKKKMDRNKREYYLREQLKAIRDELGETEEEQAFLPDMDKRLAEAGLPDWVREEAERQFARLKRMPSSSSEFMIVSTYLDWLLELPWQVTTPDSLDLVKAEKILDQNHFGLDKVKKRILEFLAVRKLKADGHRGPILCFLGPPGTGKTSMGRSIARALGRNFYRFSLGGMRDEAEIRGHRRTYVGAMPGRIIQGLRKVGANNPVIMLDEIDKLGQDFRGDPSSALLEVLDPEQNDSFVDNYLGLKFDLSRVLFIATANQRDTIPAPLFDRMEMIELAGYTQEEKVEIARKFIIPKQMKENGLAAKQLVFHKRAVARIISHYTRESGLRNLERRVAAVCRQVAHEVAKGRKERVSLSGDRVVEYLGPQRIFPEAAMRTSVPGVATGLAWTAAGGAILFVEASKTPGMHKLVLTGKLGETMQESAQTALTFLKTEAPALHIEEDLFTSQDIHIHVPAGAIPKDGPSAGVCIFVALVSLFSGRPVKSTVAFTGEITLRGNVLPVGGIKEKVLAAKRAGIRHIVLPSQNSYDLQRLSEQDRKGVQFHPITRADEAVTIAFGKGL